MARCSGETTGSRRRRPRCAPARKTLRSRAQGERSRVAVNVRVSGVPRGEGAVASDKTAEKKDRPPDKGSGGAAGRTSDDSTRSRRADGRGKRARELPDKETALALLDKMLLIRRFEERAQEMYMK